MTVVSFEADNADPAWAIHAFQRSMDKVRSLGLAPRTEHALAEQLFRGEAKVLFYSSMSGVMSLVLDDTDLTDEDPFEMVMFVMERVKARRQQKREAAVAIQGFAQHFAPAIAIETEGGDAKQAPSRSDESAAIAQKEKS